MFERLRPASPLHVWYPKDWRAMIALIASIVGGGVLTVFAWHVVGILDAYGKRLIEALVRDPNVKVAVGNNLNTVIDCLAWGLRLLLAGLIVVILSLGFAVNRRSFKLSKAGIDMEGGDDGAPPPDRVAAAAAGAAAGAVAGAAIAPVPPPPPPATPSPEAEADLPDYARVA